MMGIGGVRRKRLGLFGGKGGWEGMGEFGVGVDLGLGILGGMMFGVWVDGWGCFGRCFGE